MDIANLEGLIIPRESPKSMLIFSPIADGIWHQMLIIRHPSVAQLDGNAEDSHRSTAHVVATKGYLMNLKIGFSSTLVNSNYSNLCLGLVRRERLYPNPALPTAFSNHRG